MSPDKAKDMIKGVLSEKRYEHTIRVYDTAIILAKQYGENEAKAGIAALLHDYAKCFTIDELKDNMSKYDLPKQLLGYHFELWHGPVAAKIMAYDYGINDQDVLNAIYYHTTGRENMSTLECIIFVADYIEPGRSFPGIEQVRELATKDLQTAAQTALKNTILYLMKQDNMIHPDSFSAYNMLTKLLKER